MSKLFFTSLVLTLSCGGSKADAGKVSDESLDFCLQWANGVCRLAYLCTDEAAQDAAFHSRFGASQDDCWEGLEKRCTSNQSGNSAFGPSCGPGKTVNSAAAQTCNDSIDTQACTTWSAAPAGPCESVCDAASSGTGGASGTGGGSGSGGASSTGGTSGAGAVDTPAAYCLTSGNLTCERGFECDPTGGTSVFGNIAGCKEFVAVSCASGTPCPNGFNATLASSCLTATKAITCQEFVTGAAPAVCSSACVR